MRRFKLVKGGGNYHGKAPLDAAKKAFTQLVKSGLHRQVFQIRELDVENPKPLMYIGERTELEFPRSRTVKSPDGLTDIQITYKYKDRVRRLFKHQYVLLKAPKAAEN